MIMDLKNYSTGVQHIGIPTNDIDKTVGVLFISWDLRRRLRL